MCTHKLHDHSVNITQWAPRFCFATPILVSDVSIQIIELDSVFLTP